MEGSYLFPPLFYLPLLIVLLALARYALNSRIHRFDWVIQNSLRIAYVCAAWGVLVAVFDQLACADKCQHNMIGLGPIIALAVVLFVRVLLEVPAMWLREISFRREQLRKLSKRIRDRDE